jgi:hypothetical protein
MFKIIKITAVLCAANLFVQCAEYDLFQEETSSSFFLVPHCPKDLDINLPVFSDEDSKVLHSVLDGITTSSELLPVVNLLDALSDSDDDIRCLDIRGLESGQIVDLCELFETPAFNNKKKPQELNFIVDKDMLAKFDQLSVERLEKFARFNNPATKTVDKQIKKLSCAGDLDPVRPLDKNSYELIYSPEYISARKKCGDQLSILKQEEVLKQGDLASLKPTKNSEGKVHKIKFGSQLRMYVAKPLEDNSICMLYVSDNKTDQYNDIQGALGAYNNDVISKLPEQSLPNTDQVAVAQPNKKKNTNFRNKR